MGLALVTTMTQRRCLVARKYLELDDLVIDEPAVLTYLNKALRLKSAEKLELFDGDGAARQARIEKLDKRQLVGTWLEPLRQEAACGSKGPVAVIARLKGGGEEEAIAALAALGLEDIRLFHAERDAHGRKQAGAQAVRWQRIAEDSCRQSGGYWCSQIRQFSSLKDAIFDLERLVYGAADGAQPPAVECSGLGVVVGPEGGFSSLEIALLKTKNAVPVSLGQRVLRARHAASLLPSIMLVLGTGKT
jgi:16S rRNA (uracil1498-N3)-methyltransferase